MRSSDLPLFPPIEPRRAGMMQVDDIHTLYWEESGRPDGVPVLFLHGGPGGGTSPAHRRFFDPAHYRIVMFDQRGAGKSTPLGEYRNNTTQLLIQDIERLRELLGIERWLLFGGSWGSTLALAYGQAHPARCLGFILRGIFLCTPAEIDWFMHGMRWFFPEVHEAFVAPIPPAERPDLLQAYCRRLFSEDPAVYLPAARSWSRYEAACLFLLPDPEVVDDWSDDDASLGIGRLEAHYFRHQGFFEPDELIAGLGRIRHLPAFIVQGRYDVVCPPATAHRLHAAWPGSRLRIVGDAGHSAFEPGTAHALVAATEQFRRHGAFPETDRPGAADL
ncbi:prolyl aminopeptidase [Noviherbaspirillum aridicola]|uniref:Proline iminopeptidase n=1 Tax=Noviherbaspirillum aridicola TaxID=2849687 RepID=A0ABQ4Q4H9_9BURK|nr:prolyl aminopeptidase [Noviherbaspirillum aridicola]GIZ51725.1 proline iminopeptidase [Noviherbaspirillum aridicola]